MNYPDLSAAACNTPGGRALFEDLTPTTIPIARRICQGCPVRRECMLWGVEHETWSMWGGLTEKELAAARRKYGIRLQELHSGWIAGANHVKGARQ
jgi:hypothetical protein